VTGSARLDFYRYSGDSLQGRYHLLRLPDLVGSPLSVNALREDLRVSHKAVSNWISILERLYAVFRLSPIGSPKIRAVKRVNGAPTSVKPPPGLASATWAARGLASIRADDGW
jgi:predicted AAA+ superfamily ATPase